MSNKYEDHDWEELEDEVKAAAEVLGYTQEMWDNDEEPEDIEDEDWDDLDKKQQEAAKVLGYTKEGWDTSD
eukprot:CAMPEP_0194146088 /NCGR_PEP_ID=MMETSP0152-20130528/19560_1 /TAXON_ID=1049557 /ORGANISM="Thalassiothrix antarctica, Strain L6-D1" /LENGTH=70 /DNA_ID=CAMNT_0038846509 /DNA_START=61 /DNA_END=273 /DNA_ORIENTATION=-